MVIFPTITDTQLIEFLQGAAGYFRNRPTNGSDQAFWANEGNAERLDKAAQRLKELITPEPFYSVKIGEPL
jgi:hypothetical protein